MDVMKKYPCTACGKFLPAKAFSRDNANKSRDGLRFNCKKCQSRKDRASYARKKEVLEEKLEAIPETVPESKVIPELQTPSAIFQYKDGHEFTAHDVGQRGAIFNLLEPGTDIDESKGILFPPEQIVKFIQWLSS